MTPISTRPLRDALLIAFALTLTAAPAMAHSYTTDVTFNLTNTSRATLLLSSEYPDALVYVTYLGSKLDANGHHLVPESDGVLVRLLPGKTTSFNVDLSHPAFSSGYGAVHVRSVTPSGTPGTNAFVASVRHNGFDDPHPITGSDMSGYSFRIPVTYTRGGRLRIVITTVGSGAAVKISTAVFDDPWVDYDATFSLKAEETLRWDNVEMGYALTGEPIVIAATGRLVVSVYEELAATPTDIRRTHSYPGVFGF